MLETVATFREPWRAHIFRGRLEAEGVFALVVHENHVGMVWPYADALGGIKVQVLPGEFNIAREIEQRCRRGEYVKELEAEFGDLTDGCPNCASTDFKIYRPLVWIAALIVAYLWAGVIFPPPKARTCRACGTNWDY